MASLLQRIVVFPMFVVFFVVFLLNVALDVTFILHQLLILGHFPVPKKIIWWSKWELPACKLTYPIKNDGWKMIHFLLTWSLFSGRIRSFSVWEKVPFNPPKPSNMNLENIGTYHSFRQLDLLVLGVSSWWKWTSQSNLFWRKVLDLNRVMVSNIFYFHPHLGKMNPFWLIFFKRVETTN